MPRSLLSNRFLSAVLGFVGLTPAPAQAHVKWFCAFDVAGAPVGLENLLCLDFELLFALSVSLLLCGYGVEGTPFGTALLRSLNRVTQPILRHTETIIRVVVGGFFLSLGAGMHVILTPELSTDLGFVPWLQLAMAAAMLSRRTVPLASLGIIILFGLGIAQFGLFHLMDYPVFLGLAAYLACCSFKHRFSGFRPLNVLRWAASITLMWASIEKWAFPQWTFPIFVDHPNMSMGFDIAFYMKAAGVVEFALAFALLCSPLVRRISATILTATFVSAIAEFGAIDAVGHSCIIAIMLAIMADDISLPVQRRAVLLMPFRYSAALGSFLLAYYGLHAALFSSPVG